MAEPSETVPASIGALVADDVAPEVAGDGDSAVGTGLESDTTSLMSSIQKYRQENGRTYHSYKDGAYFLPNDDTENDRLDLQHHLFAVTIDGRLHLTPLPSKLNRVLDAGTGTGIWAVDFADAHPEAKVTGIDLSPIQPNFVPPNVEFFVDDIEADWSFSTKFDFIFARFMTGSITDWPKFFKKSLEALNPGGVIELQDIVYPLTSDDGTLTEETPLYKWSNTLAQGFKGIGRPIDTAPGYKDQLADAGFTDIVELKYKWPTNQWPKDPKHKEIGLWTHENALASLQSSSLAIYTRPKDQGGLGWSVEELDVLLAAVRKDLRNPAIHGYWQIYVVYAKKPE